jgi:NAD-dependent dihydropyrimidine dehydrogenase PreA subunit
MEKAASPAEPFIEIDPELCKGCKLCIPICPKEVIAIG